MSIYRTRRSCKVPRSPRNDSLLRTVLPLQHRLTYDPLYEPGTQSTHPRLTTTYRHNQGYRSTKLYPTTSTDHLAELNDSTDLSLPASNVQLNSTTRPTSAYQHPTSSCTQRLDLRQRPSSNAQLRTHTTATDIYIHACKYDEINCHL